MVYDLTNGSISHVRIDRDILESDWENKNTWWMAAWIASRN